MFVVYLIEKYVDRRVADKVRPYANRIAQTLDPNQPVADKIIAGAIVVGIVMVVNKAIKDVAF